MQDVMFNIFATNKNGLLSIKYSYFLISENLITELVEENEYAIFDCFREIIIKGQCINPA